MEKREEILKAAQVLFSQFGLKKVTTDDISNMSSISKATIYKYYHNKKEIYGDVIRLEFEQLMTMIRDAVESLEARIGRRSR